MEMVSLLIVVTAASVLGGHTYIEQLQNLKTDLAEDLGMPDLANVHNASVSTFEWMKMKAVWLEAERQAQLVQELRRRRKSGRKGAKQEKQIRGRLVRWKGEEGWIRARLTFPKLIKLDADALVTDAKLKVNFEGGSAQLLRLVNNKSEGVVLSRNFKGELDLSEEVQVWLEEPDTDQGLMLLLPPGAVLLGHPALYLHLEKKTKAGRDQRSMEVRSKCSSRKGGTKRCCRQDMVVELGKLKGFDFIYEPRQFNAFMCGGRCPPRFLPLNDHSLLQSLVHIREKGRVKKPCCAPSHYESMNILHLDPENRSKLKVTRWKSIVVTQCACS